MAEKTDWANLSKKELQEMLRRQEKLLANKKLLQSLPDRGDKVIATVAKLQELIARKEELEDTVAQFERMTVSRLVERTQLDILDSDDSDDDNPVDGAELHKETDGKHKKTAVNSFNKSENRPTSQTSGRKWNYESSATPPVYNFEKSKSVSLDESFKLLQEQEKRYKDLQAHHATLKLKEQGSFARTDHMTPQVVQNPLQYREAVQDDSPSDDSEQEENETRPTEMDSDDDDDNDY